MTKLIFKKWFIYAITICFSFFNLFSKGKRYRQTHKTNITTSHGDQLVNSSQSWFLSIPTCISFGAVWIFSDYLHFYCQLFQEIQLILGYSPFQPPPCQEVQSTLGCSLFSHVDYFQQTSPLLLSRSPKHVDLSSSPIQSSTLFSYVHHFRKSVSFPKLYREWLVWVHSQVKVNVQVNWVNSQLKEKGHIKWINSRVKEKGQVNWVNSWVSLSNSQESEQIVSWLHFNWDFSNRCYFQEKDNLLKAVCVQLLIFFF